MKIHIANFLHKAPYRLARQQTHVNLITKKTMSHEYFMLVHIFCILKWKMISVTLIFVLPWWGNSSPKCDQLFLPTRKGSHSWGVGTPFHIYLEEGKKNCEKITPPPYFLLGFCLLFFSWFIKFYTTETIFSGANFK